MYLYTYTQNLLFLCNCMQDTQKYPCCYLWKWKVDLLLLCLSDLSLHILRMQICVKWHCLWKSGNILTNKFFQACQKVGQIVCQKFQRTLAVSKFVKWLYLSRQWLKYDNIIVRHILHNSDLFTKIWIHVPYSGFNFNFNMSVKNIPYPEPICSGGGADFPTP